MYSIRMDNFLMCLKPGKEYIVRIIIKKKKKNIKQNKIKINEKYITKN